MVKIKFDRQKCIGCGYCEAISPNHWEMNTNDGKSDLINSTKKNNLYIAEIDFDEIDTNVDAADSCPVRVIKVEIP